MEESDSGDVYPIKPFARIGTLYSRYGKIARQCHRRMLELEPILADLRAKAAAGPEEMYGSVWATEISPHEEEYADFASIAAVFAAMAAEAFIYDYAARNLGDGYVEKYLDKLDLVSKWVVITELITGKRFPRDQRAFQLLKALVQTRNWLIHHKSADLESHEQVTRMIGVEKRHLQTCRDAVSTLEELSKVLSELDRGEISVKYMSGV